MAVQFKSYQQILGDMIRKMLSVTGLNDMNKGSVLTTLLEAAAQEDFAQYGQLIELLDNFSLDNTSGADLDKRASEFDLSRLSATSASGFVTITDSTITKISTGIYIGSSPPIAGDTVINVNDASDISFPGSIYVGRGTPNFEGPLPLSGVPVNNGSHWAIPLSTPLSKNHSLSETVIFSQGGDRSVAAGTVVKVPSNSVSGEVAFRTASAEVLADGEDTLNNVLVFASQAGSTGNAPLRSIIEFESVPFNGAQVSNPAPFSNARDLETDQELRDRIKTHIQSLSKGTKTAILSGVVGVSDSTDNKRVASASLIEPTTVTDIAELFIDDGTGFEPSFTGQGFEDVVTEAAGTEEFLQLGNFPVVKAQVESENDQPYSLPNGSTLIVRVNDEEETITFLASDFVNANSVKAIEVAEAINNKANLIEARTAGSQKRVVIFAKAINNEKIQVVGGTGNTSLLFPTDPVFTIKLYKNDVLLIKDGSTAFVESASFGNWSTGSFAVPSTFNIQVDGKHIQYLRIGENLLEVSVDGVSYVSQNGTTFNDLGTSIATASLSQWATVLDQLIVGAEVIVNGDKLKITSNQEFTPDSKIQVLDLGTPGNLIGPQGWAVDLRVGESSDFTLNRFNGQIELVEPLNTGDTVTAGTANTRANLVSAIAVGGTFDLSLNDGRVPFIVAVIDGDVVVKQINAASGSTITVAASGSLWRYTSSIAAFTNLAVGDYIVVQDQTAGAWVGAINTGIFRVEVVDPAGLFFEVNNPFGGAAGPVSVDESADIQAFSSTRPPQLVSFTVGVNTLIQIETTINSLLVGGAAEVLDDNTIRIRTNTYSDDLGSISIPMSAGNANNLEYSAIQADSLTSHTAALQSLNELGLRLPGLFGSTTTADVTDPFTSVIDTSRTFTGDDTLPGQWVKYNTGINEDIKGVIRTIVGANELLLRDNSPSLVSSDFLGAVSTSQLYQQYYPFDLEDTDNLVVVMDDDEINKTNNIPLSRSGRISSVLSTTTFDGLDTDANVSGTSFGDTLWEDYDFADYKIWFKARNVINPTNDKNAIIIRSVKFGPTGERVRVTYSYNVASSKALKASVSPAGDFTTVTVLLGTGAARATTQDGSTRFDITTGVGTTTYTYDGTGTSPGLTTVAVGDIVTFNSPNFSAGNNGTFKISATDNSTFVTVLSSTGFAEVDKTLGSTAAMSIFPLSGNSGTTIVDIINDTLIVNEVIEAILTVDDPDGTTNDGSGFVEYSTADDPAILSQYINLVDSQNWIRDFSNPASPHFTLKTALTFTSVIGGGGPIYELENTPVLGTSDLGEPFRLIPTTAKNVSDHLNKPAISSLSLNANIERSDDGERVQISSLLVGSQGQVLVSGGLGNSNLMTVQGNATPSGSYLKVPVLTAASGGFHATQQIKITNQFTTKKLNTFNSATIATVSIIAPKSFTLNKRSIGLTAGSTINITSLGSNQYRMTVAVAGSFSAVSVHDELFIPRTGAASPFDENNQGTYPIINVDAGGTYVDIINPDGVAEGPIGSVDSDFSIAVPFFTEWKKELDGSTELIVEKLSQDVVRYRWTGNGTDPNFADSGIRVDDIMTISGLAFTQGNKGRFRVLGVNNDFIEVKNANAVEEIVQLSETILSTPNIIDTVTVTTVGVLATYTLASSSWATIPAPGSKLHVPAGSPFAAGNEGDFKVLSSSASAITVINSGASAEGPIALSALTDIQYENSFKFITVDSAEAGDTLSVAALSTSWFDEKNQGQFAISNVTRDTLFNHVVEVTNTNFTGSPDVVPFGVNVSSFFVKEGTPFETYRQIDNIIINPSDDTEQFLYFSPTTHANRITQSSGSQVTSLNKLGYVETPKEGIDGYKYYTGLLRRVQRTIDGFDQDPVTFPGIKAAGVQVEVKPPLLESVTIGVDVKTTSGTPISILISAIKSAILSYITSLGVGEDVILSEIISRVQEVPGVEAVTVTNPAPVNNVSPERIIIQDNEKAIATEDDVTVG